MTDRDNGFISNVGRALFGTLSDAENESADCMFPGCNGDSGYKESYCQECKSKTIPEILSDTSELY